MRKIIQLVTLTNIETICNKEIGFAGIRETKHEFIALCDDGTVWYRKDKKWHLSGMSDIPQMAVDGPKPLEEN